MWRTVDDPDARVALIWILGEYGQGNDICMGLEHFSIDSADATCGGADEAGKAEDKFVQEV
jgi:hypothetical protein